MAMMNLRTLAQEPRELRTMGVWDSGSLQTLYVNVLPTTTICSLPILMYLLEAPVAECISELTLYSSLSLSWAPRALIGAVAAGMTVRTNGGVNGPPQRQ